MAVGLFANSQFPGITVRDGLFHGGGFAQLGSQCLEIVAIIAWSTAVVTPFFYIVGVALSRQPKNPRAGLILEFPDTPFHQADPRIHDCQEENINMREVIEYAMKDTGFLEYIDRVVVQKMKEDEEDSTESSHDHPVLDVTVGLNKSLLRRRTLSV